MIRYHASWVLPISGPPIRDGWIAVDRGRIAAYGADRHATRPGDRGGVSVESAVVDLGHVVVLPGLVNAHTHLELSYLRNDIPPADSFVDWIRRVMAARREGPDPASPEILAGIDRAVADCLACGTAVVGDISNSLASFQPLAASPLAGVVFVELIQFKAPDPQGFVDRASRQIHALPASERVQASLAAHAPYSVAPRVLRAIHEAVGRDPFAPCSIHMSESVDEVEFLRTGGGAWRRLLEDVGAWDRGWVVPGVSPVQYLDDCGFIDARLLAVHGVQMGAADLGRLAARGATLVTCPRSNVHTGAGTPPIDLFYESGVRVAVGTDSLASAPDLNVFAELAAMRTVAPAVPAARLLESATLQGARALGFDADYGSIGAGKLARLVTVDVPAGTGDVEEYLVSGVAPDRIRWLD